MKEYYEEKPEGYYAGNRPELLKLIPPGTKTLLDVGCGEGGLGLAAKKQFDLTFVAGVELFPEAAAKAREVLDDVPDINIELSGLPYPDKKFDCIICGDVLEHMVDPWMVLRRLHRVLSDTGILIASIPNIANLRVIKKMLHDTFEYESFGILDKTHLRFFTLHTIRTMLNDSGFEIATVDRTIQHNFFMKFAHIWSFGYIREANTFQFLVTARKKPENR